MALRDTYKKEFSNYIKIMGEALNHDDFRSFNVARRMLDESIDEYKEIKSLENEVNTVNFGVLNHIFESELPTLLKTNKKAIREVIKTIKEDKNLLSQFNFYDAIRRYKGKASKSVEPTVMLESVLGIIGKGIDKRTLVESNRKLRDVMKRNGIVSQEHVDDESKRLYECGQNLLCKNETVGNIVKLTESKQGVLDYMEKHKDDAVNEEVNPIDVIEEFEEKLKANLTESELDFVQEITDFKSPIAEKRKSKLFDTLKNECLKQIDKMIAEDGSNDELKALRKQIDEQQYNKDTIVRDMAKLLEIKDILMEE